MNDESPKLFLRVTRGTQGEKQYLIGRYSASKKDIIITHRFIPEEVEKSEKPPAELKPATEEEIHAQRLFSAKQQLKLYVAEESPSAAIVLLVFALLVFTFYSWFTGIIFVSLKLSLSGASFLLLC